MANILAEMGDARSDAPSAKGAYVQVRMWKSMKPAHIQWLESMAEKHKLSSPSKALRCCVNCVAAAADDNEPWIGSFEQENSFTYILSDDERQEGPVFELAKQQVDWIDGIRSVQAYPDQFIHRALFLLRIIKHCQNLDEYTVFGISRCKTSISECEGAQNAAKNSAWQYGMK